MNVKFELQAAGYCVAERNHAIRGAKKENIRFYATYGIIEHPEHGIILFDTGYSVDFFKHTKRFPYRLYRYSTKVFVTSEDEVITTLQAKGIQPDDVKYIIISHFHVDHIGGLKDFPNATFICSQLAFDTIKGKTGWAAMRHGYIPMCLPSDFESRLQLIDLKKGTHQDEDLGQLVDLFGDSSILLCDLDGHATGQMGAILQTKQGKTFLVADACWLEETYKQGKLPHPIVKLFFGSWSAFKANVQKLADYHKNNPETVIIPCHCEKTMRRVMQAD